MTAQFGAALERHKPDEQIWLGLTQSQMFSGLMALLGGAMVAGLLLRAQRAHRPRDA